MTQSPHRSKSVPTRAANRERIVETLGVQRFFEKESLPLESRLLNIDRSQQRLLELAGEDAVGRVRKLPGKIKLIARTTVFHDNAADPQATMAIRRTPRTHEDAAAYANRVNRRVELKCCGVGLNATAHRPTVR